MINENIENFDFFSTFFDFFLRSTNFWSTILSLKLPNILSSKYSTKIVSTSKKSKIFDIFFEIFYFFIYHHSSPPKPQNGIP